MEVLLVDLEQIHAVVEYLAAFDDCVRSGDTYDSLVRDRFTRAGLTHDSEGFAFVEVKIDTSDRLHVSRVGAEGNTQIFNF